AAAAGPCREVFGASPVDLVVARAKAWSRPVRDLVVLEASRAGRVTQATVLRDRRLLGGNPGCARRAPQASGIERETVRRQVIGLPVEHAGEATAPATEVEAGQPVHQVDADVSEAGLPSRHEGRARATSVVESAEDGQDGVVERLHAEAHPVDAGGPIGGELGARDAFRVALHGDL